MPWIKAVDRLPNHYWELPIKICDGGPEMYSLGQRQHGQESFQDNVNLNYYPYDQIKWLDETPSEEPNQDVLWDEIRNDMTGGAFRFPRPDIVDEWAKKYTLIRK